MPLNPAPNASAAARPSTSKPTPAAPSHPSRKPRSSIAWCPGAARRSRQQQYGIDGEHHPALPTRRQAPSPAVALGGKPVLVGVSRHRCRGNTSRGCSLMYSRAGSAQQTPTASRSFTAGGCRYNREGRAGHTEAADNGARAINRILLASVSGSGALAQSGKAPGTHKALRTKLGGTDVG